MRDAFGGAFMIKLFLVFIIIYVSFTALALNYAKAFKVKNKIVEYIESHEEVNISRMSAEELMSMEKFFEKEIRNGMNYTGNASCGNPLPESVQKQIPAASSRSFQPFKRFLSKSLGNE